MPPSNRSRAAEFGGMMLYILVGVVLFGMLIYTYTRNSGGSSNTASKGEMKLAYNSLQDAIRSYRTGVEKIVMKGYSSSDISIPITVPWDPAWFSNSNCPSPACNLFAPEGGNIRQFSFVKSFPKFADGPKDYTSDFYVGVGAWSQQGSPLVDLVASVRVTEAFCRYYNQQMGISGAPENYTISMRYVMNGPGHLGLTSDHIWSFTTPGQAGNLSGKQSGCALQNTNNGYWVLAVILAR